MIKTILIIIISVAIFGLIVFVFVKNALKRKIDQLVEDEKSDNFTQDKQKDEKFSDKSFNFEQKE